MQVFLEFLYKEKNAYETCFISLEGFISEHRFNTTWSDVRGHFAIFCHLLPKINEKYLKRTSMQVYKKLKFLLTLIGTKWLESEILYHCNQFRNFDTIFFNFFFAKLSLIIHFFCNEVQSLQTKCYCLFFKLEVQ